MRALGNLAANCKLKEAPASETDLVRANYPVFAYNWMLPPALWRQVCTLLTRGGVFRDSYDSVFSGDEQKKGIKKILLWSEKLACSRNSITGKRNSGTLTLAPACEASGRDVTDEDREWPFTAVTYKMNVHCQSRTSCHTWALEIFPENRAVINALDARKLGIRAGDKIRITSRSCALGIVAAAEPSTLVRPGCVPSPSTTATGRWALPPCLSGTPDTPSWADPCAPTGRWAPASASTDWAASTFRWVEPRLWTVWAESPTSAARA